MRKLFLILCLLLCLSLLPACGAKQDAAAGEWSVRQIAGAILDSQTDVEPLQAIEPEDALFDVFLRGNYALHETQPIDGVILITGGVSAQEIAVLRFAAEDEAKAAKAAFEAYIARREAEYTGYFPEEAEMIGASHAFQNGTTAALAICRDPDEAYRAFLRCFRSEAPLTERSFPRYQAAEPSPSPSPSETPEPEIWTYDEKRILRAWKSGDTSGLSEKDLDIYDAAADILRWNVTEEMSDWEKALAVHDWMVYNAEYDTNMLSQLPNYEEDPDNDNPYGFLVHRKGICKGYTSSFQLLMDILGVECISVQGEADGASEGWEEHAWNMIRLDGDWYVVDCTWDDPLSRGPVGDALHHRYFCVTSDFIREHNHRWDETSVPEATATKYAWTG